MNFNQTRRARVVNQERDFYRVEFGEGIFLAKIRGKLRHQALDARSLPIVGDWVHVCVESELAIIEELLPRKSLLLRKGAGSTAEQLIASNMDTVFIASSLNQDLNFNRIDRYLTLAWDSGSEPVLLFTKKDLCPNVEEILEEVRNRFLAVKAFAISVKDEKSLEELKPYFSADKSAVIVGSSGVGKSSLINFLVGKEVLGVQDIREDDAKGRHTTTSRSLWKTTWGGAIIDTPGMRELQVLDSGDGLSGTFKDIEEIELNCKFTDCQHQSEPECAIQAALVTGAIDEERFKSFLKLKRELAFQARKTDVRLRLETAKKWKKLGAMGKERALAKKRGF